jgi:hypothetical protein
LRTLKTQILQFDRMIMAWHRSSEASRRLDDIPGVGPALVHHRRACRHPLRQNPWHKTWPWLTALLTRRPAKVAAIALANKMARMAWAMMARGERYKEPVALAA